MHAAFTLCENNRVWLRLSVWERWFRWGLESTSDEFIRRKFVHSDIDPKIRTKEIIFFNFTRYKHSAYNAIGPRSELFDIFVYTKLISETETSRPFLVLPYFIRIRTNSLIFMCKLTINFVRLIYIRFNISHERHDKYNRLQVKKNVQL